jgi:serine protease Do
MACLTLGGLTGTLATSRMLQGQATQAPAPVREMTSYRDVVKKVLPAVVSVEARAEPVKVKQTTPRRRSQPFGDLPIPDEMRRFFEDRDGRGLPDEIPQGGFGSGFIVDPKGVVLTNYHVVGGAKRVDVTLADGRKFTSTDIKTDRKTDLAIVRIPAQKSPLPYLELGDSDKMEIGDRVLAAGAPFGLTGSVSAGIVSAKGRDRLRMNMYEDFIQTDAAINPGNSGGPLVNLDGQVIGINSMIRTRTGGFQGVGLAIASNLAKDVVKQLEANGTVRRGYLGVTVQELDPDVAARLGVQGEHGVLVSQVSEGKPAAKGGVQSGDVITAVAGKPVKDGTDLQRIVANLPLGKPAKVTVVRDGQPRTLNVTVEEQPEDLEAAIARPRQYPRSGSAEEVTSEKLGVDLTDLTPEIADQLGLHEGTRGAVVTQVEPNSPAGVAGLRRGMVILKVEKKAVTSAASARDLLEKATLANGILLQVVQPDGRTRFILVKAAT